MSDAQGCGPPVVGPGARGPQVHRPGACSALGRRGRRGSDRAPGVLRPEARSPRGRGPPRATSSSGERRGCRPRPDPKRSSSAPQPPRGPGRPAWCSGPRRASGRPWPAARAVTLRPGRDPLGSPQTNGRGELQGSQIDPPKSRGCYVSETRFQHSSARFGGRRPGAGVRRLARLCGLGQVPSPPRRPRPRMLRRGRAASCFALTPAPARGHRWGLGAARCRQDLARSAEPEPPGPQLPGERSRS